jgi:ribosome-binding factor A
VHALAAAVSEGVGDPRLVGITFTSATATDDLRTVRVFFAVFGDDTAVAAAYEGLKAASGYLRREVAHRLSLRYAPTLHFDFDESSRTADRISRLLHGDRPPEDAPDESQAPLAPDVVDPPDEKKT